MYKDTIMELTNMQLKQLADGLHPRFCNINWFKKNNWELLITSMAQELLSQREYEPERTVQYLGFCEVGVPDGFGDVEPCSELAVAKVCYDDECILVCQEHLDTMI